MINVVPLGIAYRYLLFNSVLRGLHFLYRKVVDDLRAALFYILISNPLVMSDTEEAERIGDTIGERRDFATTEKNALV